MTLRVPFACVSLLLLLAGNPSRSQRTYTNNSVLGLGNWYKLSVNEAGIYKIDLPFLASLGLTASSLPSSSIRLYGNGGWMLPENPGKKPADDLVENAIWVEDGGDGVLNGTDYFLFYAQGPQEWIADTPGRTFRHIKNLYSDQSFYYITIGGEGKRISTTVPTFIPNVTINSFNSRYFYELDTFNFLNSGKEWFGEEFSNAPGKTTTRTFSVNLPGANNAAGSIISRFVARSFGTGSRFDIRVNGQPVAQTDIPPVASGPFDQFAIVGQTQAPIVATPITNVEFVYTPGGFNSQGWLDWFEVHARSSLSMNGINQMAFRDWNSVGLGNYANFVITGNNNSTSVWEVSNPLQPVRMQANYGGGQLTFFNDCSKLREYIAFNTTGLLTPVAVGRVTNQNLHNSTVSDYIIITFPSFLSQAQRLANYHQQANGLKPVIVTTEQIYNEYSSGTPDPTAMRDFVKMYLDKAGGDSTKMPRYLLLFGDASFDYKSRIRNNTSLVPAYESSNSLDPLSTYTSDDFFGFLNDADDIDGSGTPLLDIGIGRLPAKNDQEAKSMVDKILGYHEASRLGPWRNEITVIADDEDNNLHLRDAELIANASNATNPVFHNDKIYLDAYKQQSSAGGSRYPEVNKAIDNKIFNGTLIWNYSGHGGFRRLAEEVILDQEIINSFNNPDKLPLFITATCDFAPYDNPLIQSIGENLLLRPKTGAIALMTTTRLVFAFSNRVMNENYVRAALRRKANGEYPTLGEAVQSAKNFTYTFFGDVINNRKFTLLGDPALTLGFPRQRVRITAINDQPVQSLPDTLKALSQYKIDGEVVDLQGNLMNAFNGFVYSSVLDKAQAKSTLGNDPGSIVENFITQENLLFKGKAKITNGKFNFSFIVPKDINYQFGNGKLTMYAENGEEDANGIHTNVIIGGTGSGIDDAQGPEIKAYLNDEKFVNGSITNNKPILLLKLYDSSGINIMGTGIGHELEATLDNDPDQRFILNDFYEADTDNFRKGSVRFQLPLIEEGNHQITIKAWDVANHSTEKILDFRVVKEEQLVLDHVLNYPNPFTTLTSFWFEHNMPGQELRVTVQIYTVSGRLVKTLKKTIISAGNRSNDVEWNGQDEYGSKLGKGVYIYRLKVQAAGGKSAERWERLYLL